MFSIIISPIRLTSSSEYLLSTAASINTAGSPKSPLFLQRYSPAVFKYVDTLCFKGESLSVNASVAFIQWFALYISNINYFWPWTKWYLFLSFHYTKGRSRSVFVSFSLSSSYFSIHHGIVYNQCKSVVENQIPESIVKLVEVGLFNPTQPVRDQGKI